MELRLINAAGWVKEKSPLFDNLVRSPVLSEITIGSITVEPSQGSTGQNFVILEDGTSVNSLQLPNKGLTGYDPIFWAIVGAIHKAGKECRLSIAVKKLEDIHLFVNFAERHGVDVLELSLECPNVVVLGAHKPVFAYDMELTREAVSFTRNLWDGPLAVKLSPYEDDEFSLHMAELMNELLYEGDSVVLCNTKGGFSPRDERSGKPILRAITPDGMEINAGGMGGAMLKPIVQNVIRIFNGVLYKYIGIDIVGGIRSGQDIIEYEAIVGNIRPVTYQVGTALFGEENVRLFSDIAEEYVRLSTTTPS